LWSYANVYRDQGTNGGRSDGKELCDLLVVCGRDIIIFSDKSITFPDSGKIEIDWMRWCKKAVFKSLNQIKGAQRWITNFPERIFLDKHCTQRFPLPIPPEGNRRFHRIVVAQNSSRPCRRWASGGDGSLFLKPSIVGMDHLNADSPEFMPCAIGDLDPSGEFVHVLDDISLTILLTELDTISDFVNFLIKKEAFVRSGKLALSAGEMELLAYYIRNTDKQGVHDFVLPDDQPQLVIDKGIWESTQRHPAYLRRKNDDKISYVWDRLILIFTKPMMDGSLLIWGNEFDIKRHELAVRIMAKETRLRRRGLSVDILEAIKIAHPEKRFARIIVEPGPMQGGDTGYIFLQLPNTNNKYGADYDAYREVRRQMLDIYCHVTKSRFPYLQRVIGIGTEPPKYTREGGTSEDLVLIEFDEWSEEQQKKAEKMSKELNIFSEKTTKYSQISLAEYEYNK
jgi:hypothetical protein